MKYVMLLLVVLCLGGCAMVHTTPEPVVQGALLSAQMAEINQKNVRAVNNEYHRMLVAILEEVYEDDPEKLEQMIAVADELKAAVGAKFYRPAEINAELARAIAAYLKTPGIGLEKLETILQMIAAK